MVLLSKLDIQGCHNRNMLRAALPPRHEVRVLLADSLLPAERATPLADPCTWHDGDCIVNDFFPFPDGTGVTTAHREAGTFPPETAQNHNAATDYAFPDTAVYEAFTKGGKILYAHEASPESLARFLPPSPGDENTGRNMPGGRLAAWYGCAFADAGLSRQNLREISHAH